jgi:hypothetical protein
MDYFLLFLIALFIVSLINGIVETTFDQMIESEKIATETVNKKIIKKHEKRKKQEKSKNDRENLIIWLMMNGLNMKGK